MSKEKGFTVARTCTALGPFPFVLILQEHRAVHTVVGARATGKKQKLHLVARKQTQTSERPESYTPQGYAPVTQTRPYITSQ